MVPRSNELALLPNRKPRSQVVGSKLAIMEKRIAELDMVIAKLVSAAAVLPKRILTAVNFNQKQKQFRRMNTVIDNMEGVLIEAHKVKGWQWVHEEPLWVTWSLEKFGK